MIVYKTKMERLPENCRECDFQWCRLPLKKNTNSFELKNDMRM